MRRLITISLAAMATALIAPPALAQAQPWTASGELTDADAQGDEEHRYDDHRIRLEAGQRYRLSVDSDAFDPLARLLRAGQTEVIAENDDFGDGLNSRIAFTPTESGDYVLRVTGFSSDARGAYTAEVAQLPPLPAPISQPGETVPVTGSWSLWRGDLAATDPDRDGKHYDDYLIHVAEGQIRYILLEGQAWDTLVQVYRLGDREGEPIEQDDDTGAGVNSLLAFAPEEAGDYIVRVTSFEENVTGAYRLWVSQ